MTAKLSRTAAAALTLAFCWTSAASAQDSPASSGDANPDAAAAEEQAQRQLPGGGVMRADDYRRLVDLDRSAGLALRQALAGGSQTDVQALTAALADNPLSPEAGAEHLQGDWSCQMMKLGKIGPLVVYPPFSCRIGADGGFEKLTGSQRTAGRIMPWEGQLIYLGTAYIAGDTPPDYADLPDTVDVQADPQIVPDAGIFEVTGPDRARILFPQPWLESDMNLLSLTR